MLLDRLKSRPERRSTLVAKELQQYHMDVVTLAERRIHRKGDFVEKSAGYGREETYKGESGVGFAVKTTLASKLKELLCAHSDRLMFLRLPLRKGRYATLISAYAPTMNSSEDDKLAFYLSLLEIIHNIPHEEIVVILSDFNARVGAD
uniref:Endonuclease/exonuclease/phosphatase domain-containing protein n=1 Tax=Octopus bimaculoides TaxID=37653 RepID=A0A0L8IH48_OCTBM